MATVFNNLKNYKLNEFDTIFPLDKEELSLFKKAGRFSKKIIRNRNRLSSQIENCINDYEALSFYCQKGVSPWWVSSVSEFKPTKILYNLFVDDYELFMQFIQSIKSDTPVMRRLTQLIDKTEFFNLYNNLSSKDKFLKYFLLFQKQNDYKLLLKSWLMQPFNVKIQFKDIKFEKWLTTICKNNNQLSSSVCLILKRIISKIKNDSDEKNLFLAVNNIYNQLLVSTSSEINSNGKT